MAFIKTAFSAIGKLAALALLLTAFLMAMAGVVYMSLSGKEITVPEITGKDFFESEKELAALGLKIKKRADRPSGERINTVLEQLPKPGETVKTGQLIFVVVSKAGQEGEEAPKSLIKDLETEDDTKTIEEMISDKPKKAKTNSNANTKKKADTTRDVNSNSSNSNSDEKPGSKSGEPDKKETPSGKEPGEKGEKNPSPANTAKPSAPQSKPPAKPSAGETRNRVQTKP